MYRLRFNKSALKQLKKLDPFVQKKIYDYLLVKVDNSEDPRIFGKELTGELSGSWRYRIGDYRVICHIDDNYCEVLAMKIGHRSKVYS
jgi:mRNA interferase RelE/StbE